MSPKRARVRIVLFLTIKSLALKDPSCSFGKVSRDQGIGRVREISHSLRTVPGAQAFRNNGFS